MFYSHLELVRHLIRRAQPNEYGSGGVLPLQDTEFAVVFKLRPNYGVVELFNLFDSILDNGSCVGGSEILEANSN